jgi:hypothetical protein
MRGGKTVRKSEDVLPLQADLNAVRLLEEIPFEKTRHPATLRKQIDLQLSRCHASITLREY